MRGCAMGSRSRRAVTAERVLAMCARAQRLGLVAVPTKPGVWEIHTADGMERVAEAGNLRACERWLDGFGAVLEWQAQHARVWDGPPDGNGAEHGGTVEPG